MYMLDEAKTSPVLRVVAGLMAVGLLATSILPLSGGFSNAFKDTGGVLVDQKLHRVPVFTVSDDEGRPFLVEAEDHLSRQGYFFLDPKDAEKYLARVKEEGAVAAKVLPVGMDEALKFTMKRSRKSAKAVPEVFSLFPSERELSVASESTGGQFSNIFGEGAVPIYYADGLAFASPVAGGDSGVAGGSVGAVYPLFFEKSKLDETLSGLQEKDPAAAKAIGDIQVLSLQQTVKVSRHVHFLCLSVSFLLCVCELVTMLVLPDFISSHAGRSLFVLLLVQEMKAGSNERLQRVMFLPLDDSLAALRADADASKKPSPSQ